MVRDAVCGMQVDPEQAPSTEVAGRTFYFCAEGCKNAFELEELAGGGLFGDPSMIPCRYAPGGPEQRRAGGAGETG